MAQTIGRTTVSHAVRRFFGGLRFPWLLVLTAALFLLDLLIPDLVPFADEILLGLATLLFAAWRKRRDEQQASS